MANTVSRRLVFVKMKLKRRRSPQKPRLPSRDDDEMVGEVARLGKPLLTRKPPVVQRKAPWSLIAAGIGGLIGVVGVIVLLVGLVSRSTDAGASAQETHSNPGYSRSASSRGYPGSGLGAGGAGAGGADRRAVASTDAFLAAPFPKRKPTRCAVQIDGGEESRRDFSKCLEQANENQAAPGRE